MKLIKNTRKIRCEMGGCKNIADYMVKMNRAGIRSGINICATCLRELGVLAANAAIDVPYGPSADLNEHEGPALTSTDSEELSSANGNTCACGKASEEPALTPTDSEELSSANGNTCACGKASEEPALMSICTAQNAADKRNGHRDNSARRDLRRWKHA